MLELISCTSLITTTVSDQCNYNRDFQVKSKLVSHLHVSMADFFGIMIRQEGEEAGGGSLPQQGEEAGGGGLPQQGFLSSSHVPSVCLLFP